MNLLSLLTCFSLFIIFYSTKANKQRKKAFAHTLTSSSIYKRIKERKEKMATPPSLPPPRSTGNVKQQEKEEKKKTDQPFDEDEDHHQAVYELSLDDLTCFVGGDILSSPVTLSCGHTFSKSTVRQMIRENQTKCPQVSPPLKALPIHPSLYAYTT